MRANRVEHHGGKTMRTPECQKMFNRKCLLLIPHSLFPSVFCDALIVSLKTNIIETKNLSFNGMELPQSLGYGILDPGSVRYDDGELYAEYVFKCDGSVVHEVRWNKKSCTLFTYCHGASGNISFYPNLEYALLYDCRSWDLSKDDCYLFLAGEISKLGNIYINLPELDAEKYSANFYPAGKIFILSLPIVEKIKSIQNFWNRLKTQNTLSSPMKEMVRLYCLIKIQKKPSSQLQLQSLMLRLLIFSMLPGQS